MRSRGDEESDFSLSPHHSSLSPHHFLVVFEEVNLR